MPVCIRREMEMRLQAVRLLVLHTSRYHPSIYHRTVLEDGEMIMSKPKGISAGSSFQLRRSAAQIFVGKEQEEPMCPIQRTSSPRNLRVIAPFVMAIMAKMSAVCLGWMPTGRNSRLPPVTQRYPMERGKSPGHARSRRGTEAGETMQAIL